MKNRSSKAKIFHAVEHGTVSDVLKELEKNCDLTIKDKWARTPLLLAIETGDIAKAKILLDAGANRNDKGPCAKLPVGYAIEHDDDEMLQWLIEKGFHFDVCDYFGDTPLINAAENGSTKCVKVLINAGVNIFKKDEEGDTAIASATNADIANLLIKAGDDINDIDKGYITEIDHKVRCELLSLRNNEIIDVTEEEYIENIGRIFGKSNPEICTKKFWYEMVRSGASAWKAHGTFNYRNPEPIWTYNRFGKSITDIGNGEYIEIAGEHEDHYDQDFCIYNEVFHHRGNGEFTIYMYPKEVFPPTDFHTATLVNEYIYIIGNLGYNEERAYGTTPVYRLNTRTFKIDKVVTKGDNPRWIYHHKAYYDGKSIIRIKGGNILSTDEGKEASYLNKDNYDLCLNTFKWTCCKTHQLP
ncbi:MAG: ankyrin repeat domain-containing protein [Kangiellaceae bacterium]|nr:ankyrin repeat domain-containing protein [Kangiellaceae bacterium]